MINEIFIKKLRNFLPDERDIIVIKFLISVGLCNTHIDIKCKFCGKENIIFHYFNDCSCDDKMKKRY